MPPHTGAAYYVFFTCLHAQTLACGSHTSGFARSREAAGFSRVLNTRGSRGSREINGTAKKFGGP